MDNQATNSAGFQAPSRIKAVYWSTYLHIPTGKTYRQIDPRLGNNWEEVSVADRYPTSSDIEAVLDNGDIARAGQKIKGEGGASSGFMDLTAGTRWYFDGAGTGAPVTGFYYSLVGDYTFYYQVGGIATVRATNGGVNDGVHTLTTVLYDGVNTYIQWADMTTVLGAPYGSIEQASLGNVKFGNDSSYHYAASFGPGFGFAGIYNEVTPTAYGDWFSFFGYTYIWENDFTDPLLVNQRQGGFNIYGNLFGDGIVTLGNIDSFPVSASVSQAIARQGVRNAGAGGARHISMKTDEAWYSRRFIIHHGASVTPNETVIDATVPTADRTITLPDADMNFETAITETLNFPGVASGEVLTMTFTNGILTARTVVP